MISLSCSLAAGTDSKGVGSPSSVSARGGSWQEVAVIARQAMAGTHRRFLCIEGSGIEELPNSHLRLGQDDGTRLLGLRCDPRCRCALTDRASAATLPANKKRARHHQRRASHPDRHAGLFLQAPADSRSEGTDPTAKRGGFEERRRKRAEGTPPAPKAADHQKERARPPWSGSSTARSGLKDVQLRASTCRPCRRPCLRPCHHPCHRPRSLRASPRPQPPS